MACQKSLVQLANNQAGVRIHNLVTIGATTMIESDGVKVSALENLFAPVHPFWSLVTVYDPLEVKPKPTNCAVGNAIPADPPLPQGTLRERSDSVVGL